jgi:hypothetical protein
MAVCQTDRYRGVAVLARSYRSYVCCATARHLDDGESPTRLGPTDNAVFARRS